MRFNADVPEHTIDLALDPSERWDEVIAASKRDARALVKEVSADMGTVSWLAKPFRLAYRATSGRCLEESDAWAEALGIDAGLVLMAQCSYELSHAGEWRGSIFGCTAGIVDGAHGPAHVRTLDWPVSSITRASRVFHFEGGEHPFTIVGIAGFVGALSGMVPGGYSVTINYAPPCERPGFDFGPALLLREVLETCSTYAQAVAALRDTTLAAPVFFTVCGAKPEQGCVIERTREEAVVRRLPRRGFLVQANHFNGRGFTHLNEAVGEGDEESVFEASSQRQDAMREGLEGVRDATSSAELERVLAVDPVTNDQTVQRMVFWPASGEYAVWRRV